MGVGPSRMVVLESRAPVDVEIWEHRQSAPSDQCVVRLKPRGRAEIAAAKISDRNTRSLRASTIKILVNGLEVQNPLRPQKLLLYVKVIFEVNDYGLVVKGVRASYSDLCRLQGFGFLGREYGGREEELIT